MKLLQQVIKQLTEALECGKTEVYVVTTKGYPTKVSYDLSEISSVFRVISNSETGVHKMNGGLYGTATKLYWDRTNSIGVKQLIAILEEKLRCTSSADKELPNEPCAHTESYASPL